MWKDYDETYEVSTEGLLRNKKRGFIRKPTTDKQGYSTARIKNKSVAIHRLVALLFIPNPDNLSDVDHINGNKMDNRVENLRWLSRSHNLQNSKGHQDSKSGVKGIDIHKPSGKWRARICVDYIIYDLGLYENKDDAIQARRKAVQDRFTCPHSIEIT